MKQCLCFSISLLLVFFFASSISLLAAPQDSWNVIQVANELQISYGNLGNSPQYGALHLDSSYFRLVYSPTAGWGTSVILLPSFWSIPNCPPPGLCQGAPISATWHTETSDLIVTITGTIGGLNVYPTVRLLLPANNVITAQVSTQVQGTIPLNPRPGETFKPVMLSSMRISTTQWDTSAAFANGNIYAIPSSGWIIYPPTTAQKFGLLGGTSCWKTNAPKIEITMDRLLQTTGWVTPSVNPNDDNIGFWMASDSIISSYGYAITSTLSSDPKFDCTLFFPRISKNH